jgi:hypothetical protein
VVVDEDDPDRRGGALVRQAKDGNGFGRRYAGAVVISLSSGVVPLLRLLGESALTVELTIDFENDVHKSAVVFPGAAEDGLGYERVSVDGVDVWWRQRLVLGTREPRVTTKVRPRMLRVATVGRALSATADYA